MDRAPLEAAEIANKRFADLLAAFAHEYCPKGWGFITIFTTMEEDLEKKQGLMTFITNLDRQDAMAMMLALCEKMQKGDAAI